MDIWVDKLSACLNIHEVMIMHELDKDILNYIKSSSRQDFASVLEQSTEKYQWLSYFSEHENIGQFDNTGI